MRAGRRHALLHGVQELSAAHCEATQSSQSGSLQRQAGIKLNLHGQLVTVWPSVATCKSLLSLLATTSLVTILCRSFNLAQLDNAFLGYEAVTSVVRACWGVKWLAQLIVSSWLHKGPDILPGTPASASVHVMLLLAPEGACQRLCNRLKCSRVALLDFFKRHADVATGCASAHWHRSCMGIRMALQASHRMQKHTWQGCLSAHCAL